MKTNSKIKTKHESINYLITTSLLCPKELHIYADFIVKTGQVMAHYLMLINIKFVFHKYPKLKQASLHVM